MHRRCLLYALCNELNHLYLSLILVFPLILPAFRHHGRSKSHALVGLSRPDRYDPRLGLSSGVELRPPSQFCVISGGGGTLVPSLS